MIRTLTWFTIGMLALPALAQEPQRIPAEAAERVVQFLAPEFAKLASPPLKVELDPKRAGGISAGDSRAVLGILDQAFTAESVKAAKEKPVAVGILLMLGGVPAVEGKAVPSDRLKVLTITTPAGEVRKLTVLWLRLKTVDGKLNLEILSNGDQALLTVPVSEVTGGDSPVVIDPKEATDQRSKLTLTVLGKWQVTLEAVAP